MRFRDELFDLAKGLLMSFFSPKLFHIFQLYQVREFLGFICQVRDKSSQIIYLTQKLLELLLVIRSFG